jgi:hypothetical protein
MSTNKISLKTSEEFMDGYEPVYKPIFPLFLSKGVKHDEKVGQPSFRRVEAIGDIRGKHVTPKDTELHQVNSTDSKKVFKKYFLANQYKTSILQDEEGFDDVVKQVLDEHQIQMDELLLLGEGTSTSTMINNGLYWSNDVNYVLESSDEIATGDARLPELHGLINAAINKAELVAGKKLVIIYGALLIPYYNSLYSASQKAFKAALQEINPDVDFIVLPANCTPSGANGFIVVNMDKIKLHYTTVPKLMKQGLNEEDMYNWANFIMGSMMVEVTAKYGIVRQPITFA